MNGVTKKNTKTHKAKSAESILLQQNHRSKNIIICQKITKQSKQNSYTSFEMHHFSKGEVILHYFSYNERCLLRNKIESPLDFVINKLYCTVKLYTNIKAISEWYYCIQNIPVLAAISMKVCTRSQCLAENPVFMFLYEKKNKQSKIKKKKKILLVFASGLRLLIVPNFEF